MKSLVTALVCCLATSVIAAEGLVVKPSNYSVGETLDRLEGILKDKGLKIIARIDHQAGAAGAGLDLPPTQVLIFGNPNLGTPLMTSAPTTAIDLPQKALAYQGDDGKVYLAYNDIGYLQARHGIEGQDEIIAKIRGALGKFTDAATQ
ncbi:MAG: DUF302 domain-containing protein [Alphaproteobacteria bacterium]|nr:DUF302 domain-containing protein [Alphaproteobacteria bacterium]